MSAIHRRTWIIDQPQPLKAEIHSLNWLESDPRLAEEQKGVFSHFHLPLTQHHRKLDHSSWMDAVLQWAAKQNSFLGLAQATNHINKCVHVFAAPAFLAIPRTTWQQLGQPSCRPTPSGDVAEELSWRAEEQGLPYKAWYPTDFHHPSRDGLWRMGN